MGNGSRHDSPDRSEKATFVTTGGYRWDQSVFAPNGAASGQNLR